MTFGFTKGYGNTSPSPYPLPSREGKITLPHSSPYLRGGWVGLIPLPLWERVRVRGI
jgi:hypothetical protein